MLVTSLLFSSLLAKGLVADHPDCKMSPLNQNYSVCFIGSASSDGENINGTDASIGTAYFVDKAGKMYLAEPGRYIADKSVAKVEAPFIVRDNGDYREYIGASELKDGTKVEFYFFDALGHTCDIYIISEDGKKFTELKDGKYALKNGQIFRVEGGVVQTGIFDPETGKIIDPLADEKAGGNHG